MNIFSIGFDLSVYYKPKDPDAIFSKPRAKTQFALPPEIS